MSRNYDNWDRLVAAVIKRQHIWQLCHQPSRSPSICSEASSSDFSSMTTRIQIEPEDLMRAPTEILGKGTFGTTYKAVLEDATTVAVKRLKEDIVGKKEFEQQMEIVATIMHENVAPLRAYYYYMDQKIIIYDYYSQGSVSALLNGKNGENTISLDWVTRLKIAIGVARGIAHIHSQSGGKFVHGNINTSNIFLNSQLYGCVSDLGLATLMSTTLPPLIRSGYRASEVKNTRKALQAFDVYSYGVFLLELLTGRSPGDAPFDEKVVHFIRWVQMLVHEEWICEEFDKELILRYSNIKLMESMLDIGLICVSIIPEQRPKIEDVLKILEALQNKFPSMMRVSFDKGHRERLLARATKSRKGLFLSIGSLVEALQNKFSTMNEMRYDNLNKGCREGLSARATKSRKGLSMA